MMSSTGISVIALLCWMVVAQAGDADISDDAKSLLAVSNGVFDNSDQVKGENQERPSVQLRLIPLKLSFLGGLAYYLDEKLNGVFYRQEVTVLTEERNHLFYMNVFNFTNSSRPDPDNVDPDAIDYLKAEDFQMDPSCSYTFEKVAPGVYKGSRPDCRDTINGQHPVYVTILACDGYRITAPTVSKENTNLGAYVLTRKGERFPQRNLPDNYVSPCDKSSNE